MIRFGTVWLSWIVGILLFNISSILATGGLIGDLLDITSLPAKGSVWDYGECKEGTVAAIESTIAKVGTCAVVAEEIKNPNWFESEMENATCLHFAVLNGNKDLVLFLLRAGADVEAKDLYGRTPLHWAGKRNYPMNLNDGRPKMAEILLDFGAKVDARADDEKTPLHEAAYSGFAKMVRVLLRNGADIEALDKNGHPPLYLAVSRKERYSVEELIKWGASLQYANETISSSKSRKSWWKNTETLAVKWGIEGGEDQRRFYTGTTGQIMRACWERPQNPCQPNGDCSIADEFDNFSCRCNEGWTGKTCLIDAPLHKPVGYSCGFKRL